MWRTTEILNSLIVNRPILNHPIMKIVTRRNMRERKVIIVSRRRKVIMSKSWNLMRAVNLTDFEHMTHSLTLVLTLPIIDLY